MLTPEIIKQFDGLVLDFLQEKDILDVQIMRMPSREFAKLRFELAVYLYRKSNPTRTQGDVGDYFGYKDPSEVSKILSKTAATAKKKREAKP